MERCHMQAALHFRHADEFSSDWKHILKFTKYTRLWMALPKALCYNLRRDPHVKKLHEGSEPFAAYCSFIRTRIRS